MARRKLTLEEQLKGIRAAVRSKRTPPQLREGLRKRAKWLIEQIRLARPRKRSKKSFSKRRVRTNQ
jgi:signal transduction histidine kinase